MAFNILAEAVLRIEHKIDALLNHFSAGALPMHFVGSVCPVCRAVVDYTVNIEHGVVVRRCDCKTGKIPATIPLLPVEPGQIPNGYPSDYAPVSDSDGAKKGSGRKAR